MAVYQMDLTKDYIKFLSNGTILIIVPAMISTGVSMSTQIVNEQEEEEHIARCEYIQKRGRCIDYYPMVYVAHMLWYIMYFAEVEFDRRLAITGCLAFARLHRLWQGNGFFLDRAYRIKQTTLQEVNHPHSTLTNHQQGSNLIQPLSGLTRQRCHSLPSTHLFH